MSELKDQLQSYLDNTSKEELLKEIDKRSHLQKIEDFPWYKKDKYGWPIETTLGHPFANFVRILFQNLRKIEWFLPW